jgi:hypothetical protein
MGLEMLDQCAHLRPDLSRCRGQHHGDTEQRCSKPDE